MSRRLAIAGVALAGVAALAACVADTGGQPDQAAAVVQPIATPAPTPVAAATPTPSPTPAGPTTFVFDGELTQGGWIRGQVPAGTVSAMLGGEELAVGEGGRFFAAFDRDAGSAAVLRAELADGRVIESPLRISPREWNIEHVNVARRGGGASEAFMRIRRPELERIAAARATETGAEGWRQDFVWPVTGRISGRFGSQRIYRGEPGSYHTGIDVTTGTSGTPFVAPADGVVVLASAEEEFSLEGHLLMIDHGMGLNSAFLHASEITVREGETVTRGQMIGRIGASGRATGPHLHWSLKWRDARLDPLLFTGPME